MSTRTITVEVHQAGQPRPYADSFYEATLTFSWRPPEAVVRLVAPPLILTSNEKVAPRKAEQKDWAQAYFDFVRPEAQGVWRVRIIRPYDD